MRAHAIALLLPALLTGCVTAATSSCPGGMQTQVRAELIFGRNLKTGGIVGEAAWRRFVAEEVTPRFPDGFTVLNGRGQWRDPQGRVVREPSKVLLVAMPDTPERRARLGAIVEAYKRAFGQDSVLTLATPSCVSF